MANWLTKLLGGKLLQGAPRTEVYLVGREHYTEWDYKAHARDGYKRNASYFRALQMIATNAASVEPTVWQPTTTRGKLVWEQLVGHPVLKWLNGEINPLQGRVEWMEDTLLTAMLGGQVFNLCAMGGGKPVYMYPKSPDVVSPVYGEVHKELQGYVYHQADGNKPYGTDTCWWYKTFNPTDQYDGQPLLQAAGESVETGNKSREYNRSVLKNSGIAGLKVTYSPKDALDQTLPADVRDRLKEQLRLREQGEAGKNLLLEGGLDAGPLGYSPDEMSVHETQKEADRAVAVCSGVDSALLGDAANKTYSNYQEARKALYIDVVLPTLDRFYSSLTRFLKPYYPGDWALGYDRSSIDALKEDQTALWARVSSAQGLSVDEKRELLGFDKLPAGLGKVILVPAGQVTLDMVSLPPVPRANPFPAAGDAGDREDDVTDATATDEGMEEDADAGA